MFSFCQQFCKETLFGPKPILRKTIINSQIFFCLKLLSAIFLVLSFFSCTKTSQNSPSQNSFQRSAFAQTSWLSPLSLLETSGTDSSVYFISLSGANLGTVAVRQKIVENAQETQEMEFRFLHRVGNSPIFSRFNAKLESPDKIKISVTSGDQGLYNSSFSFYWQKKNGQVVSSVPLDDGEPAKWFKLFGINVNVTGTSVPEDLPLGLPANENSEKNLFVINPLSGLKQTLEEARNTKYSKEHSLLSASVNFRSDMVLQLNSVDQKSVKEILEKSITDPVDSAFFSTEKSLADDLNLLQNTAEQGVVFAVESERLLKQKMSQVPYLVNRKFANFRRLCERILQILESQEPQKTRLANLGRALDSVLNEDIRELPKTLSQQPELLILADPLKSWLFAKVLSRILVATHSELSQTLAIEQEQKISVAMNFQLEKLTKGSIVKGTLVSKKINHSFQLEVGPNVRYRFQTIKKAHEFLVMNQGKMELKKEIGLSLRAELLDGASFASGEFAALGFICEKGNGQIGIDLSDSSTTLLQTGQIRGLWDSPNRLLTLREFVKRASSFGSCKKLIVRIPESLKFAATAELNAFYKDVFQTEREFQATNGSLKTLRVVPGIYELVLTSLVNGAVLHRQELDFELGKASHFRGKSAVLSRVNIR